MCLLSCVIPLCSDVSCSARCLDSLVFDAASYKDVEIIVVLESPSDKVRFSQKYHDIPNMRFAMKSTDNTGDMLRAGIEAATGKYIKIVNPVGWADPWRLSGFAKKLKKLDCDVVVVGYQSECLKHESMQEIQPLTAIQEKSIQQEAELLEVLPWPALIVKASILKSVVTNPAPETFYFAHRCLILKALARTKSLKIFKDYIFRVSEEALRSHEVVDFGQRLGSEQSLRALLADLDLRQDVILTAFLQRMINEHYELYYQNHSATRKEVAEILAFTKFLKREFSDFYNSTPAAKNIALRLSWPSRKIKQVLMG